MPPPPRIGMAISFTREDVINYCMSCENLTLAEVTIHRHDQNKPELIGFYSFAETCDDCPINDILTR